MHFQKKPWINFMLRHACILTFWGCLEELICTCIMKPVLISVLRQMYDMFVSCFQLISISPKWSSRLGSLYEMFVSSQPYYWYCLSFMKKTIKQYNCYKRVMLFLIRCIVVSPSIVRKLRTPYQLKCGRGEIIAAMELVEKCVLDEVNGSGCE